MKDDTWRDRIPIKIVSAFALSSCLWIYFSDSLLHVLVSNRELATRLAIYKGWMYVFVSSSLLYGLVLRYMAKVRRSEADIRRERELNRLLLDSIPNPAFLITRDRRIKAVNSAGKHVGATEGDYCWCGIYALKLVSAEEREVYQVIGAPLAGTKCLHCKADNAMDLNKAHRLDVELDGATWDTWWIPVDADTYLHYAIDITERKRLEERFRHSHKMESIGTLAGGVAHDFNNILTVIMGYVSLIKLKADTSHNVIALADDILASVNRGAEMTQSLLAFSRKQEVNLQPIDLNRLIKGLHKSLSRLIRENIHLVINLSDRPLFVLADNGQIEQVVINLVVNARDAMPTGGVLTISTEEVETGGEQAKTGTGDLSGVYGQISVADNGVGISSRIQEQIFEPFFTTKRVGEGTGLGLSMAYGIVKTHNGSITVDSTEGEGAVFRICLPLTSASLHGEDRHRDNGDDLPFGNETLLLVEDDAAIRTMTSMLLEKYGYRVLVAVDGEDGVAVFRENQDSIQVLVTDLVMPRKNGREMYEQICGIRPDIPAIFMSGYDDNIMDQAHLDDNKVCYLAKPLSPAAILNKIREIVAS